MCNVRKKIEEFEKMKNDPKVKEQLLRAKKTLTDLENYKEILEERKSIYQGIRNNSKKLKDQIEDFQEECKKLIDLIDWYKEELKKKSIDEDLDTIEEAKKKAIEAITYFAELKGERSIVKYGANKDKIFTLKSCKAAIENLESTMKKLSKCKDEKSIKETEEIIKKYMTTLSQSKRYLPKDTSEYEKFYKKLSNYVNQFKDAVNDLKVTIGKFKLSTTQEDGLIDIIRTQINSITRKFFVENVIQGMISGLGGLLLNYLVVPGIIYAWNFGSSFF